MRVMQVLQEIGGARLVAVTKGRSSQDVDAVIAEGAVAIGESRVNEAVEKRCLVSGNAEWHLVGHLQSNKARAAVDAFDVIQSVDSEKIARKVGACAIDAGKGMPVLVQINTSGKGTQHGIALDGAAESVGRISTVPGLDVRGLMTIADEKAPGPCFKSLFLLNSRLGLEWLSMGMSSDYKIALEEGSNMVRLGRCLFE